MLCNETVAGYFYIWGRGVGGGSDNKASNNMSRATKLQDNSEENYDVLLPW